jgi:hypothetical protein
MQTMSPDVDFADDPDQGAKMAGSTPRNKTSTSRSNKLYALGIAVACGLLIAAILPIALIVGEEKGDPVLPQQELENSARFLAFGFPTVVSDNDVSNGNTNIFGITIGSDNTVLNNDVSNGNIKTNGGFSIWDFLSGSDTSSQLLQEEDEQFGAYGSFFELPSAVGPNNDPFLSIEAPFQAELALFNEDIVGQPYADPARLKEDLGNAVRFLLNIVVKRNTGVEGFEKLGVGGRNPNGGGREVILGAAVTGTSFVSSQAGFASAASPPQAAAADSAQGPTVGNNVNDFGTNNQEKDVEEGDLIVSDGERGK